VLVLLQFDLFFVEQWPSIRAIIATQIIQVATALAMLLVMMMVAASKMPQAERVNASRWSASQNRLHCPNCTS
jgi:hypothetical protein